jgi:hypothetical protein
MLWPLQKGLYDGVNGVAQLLHEIDTAAPSVHGVDVSQVSNRPRVWCGAVVANFDQLWSVLASCGQLWGTQRHAKKSISGGISRLNVPLHKTMSSPRHALPH